MKARLGARGIKHSRRIWEISTGRKVGTDTVEEQKRKSDAYFGKSLVRLACKQEKNKEKSESKTRTK